MFFSSSNEIKDFLLIFLSTFLDLNPLSMHWNAINCHDVKINRNYSTCIVIEAGISGWAFLL